MTRLHAANPVKCHRYLLAGALNADDDLFQQETHNLLAIGLARALAIPEQGMSLARARICSRSAADSVAG